MGEIRLAGHRAQRSEFGHREARDIMRVPMRIFDPFEPRLDGRGGKSGFSTEQSRAGRGLGHEDARKAIFCYHSF